MTIDIKLLPHQYNFIKSTTNTLLVGGYGSGKSHSGTIKTIFKKFQYPDKKVAYYLPTYGLIRDIAFEKFPDALSQMGIKYTLNKSDKEIHIQNNGSILFRSMDTPETIIGYETAYALIDEADILPMDKMETVYNKILGRNRAVDNACVDAVSTPEGFKWLYHKSMTNDFNVIRAKTTDNKHLKAGYIEKLMEQYPPQLLEAYINGEFVNLTSGTIFSYFKRDIHHSDMVDTGVGSILISQDFNIGGCVSCVYIMPRGTTDLIQIDEFESYDTQEVIENIKQRYPNRLIEVYPDASGANRKTSSSQSDLDMLRRAGFRVFANRSNPTVRDRITITNNCFHKNLVNVNTNKCPRTTKAYEQHGYKANGDPEKFGGAGTVDDYTDAATYILAYKYPLTGGSLLRALQN